jgi:hypothetical protein
LAESTGACVCGVDRTKALRPALSKAAVCFVLVSNFLQTYRMDESTEAFVANVIEQVAEHNVHLEVVSIDIPAEVRQQLSVSLMRVTDRLSRHHCL